MVLTCLFCMQAAAQLKVGDGSFTLYSGTALKIEDLVLLPTTPFSFTSNELQQSADPVQLNGSVASIGHVVWFRNPVVFTGLVRLFYDPLSLNGNPEAELKLSYKATGGWQYSATGIVNPMGICVDEVLTARSFEGLTASAYYVPLPVNLVSFTARWAAGNTVLLHWQTAAEANNSHYSVERSTDGMRYTAIGIVRAAAQGQATTYSFIDQQPQRGTSFYRLRQHDRDGQQRLLGVRLVQADKASGVATLYPNPVTGDSFTVDLQTTVDKPLSYTISNASGLLVQTGRINSQHQRIATASLPAGVYLLQLGNGQTLRFQKQ